MTNPGHRNSQGGTVRRDKRGRRIGYNWWREYNCRMLYDYNDAVAVLDGENHQMEPDEFRAAHPRLTLKQCLVGNAGMAPIM